MYQLQVQLLPIRMLNGNKEAIFFRYSDCDITINVCCNIEVNIIGNKSFEELFSLFMVLNKFLQICLGYFYDIKYVLYDEAVSFIMRNPKEIPLSYIKSKRIEAFYNTFRDFKNNSNKLLQLSNQTVNEKIIKKFKKIYDDNTIIHNGFLYSQSCSGYPIDKKLAEIVQCFEHFGRYISRKSNDNEQTGLSNNLKYVFLKYPLSFIPNDYNKIDEYAKDNSNFDKLAKKCAVTRDYIMHYDKNAAHFDGKNSVYWYRIFHTYYRYVFLHLVLGSKNSEMLVKQNAENQISSLEKWKHKMLKKRKIQITSSLPHKYTLTKKRFSS